MRGQPWAAGTEGHCRSLPGHRMLPAAVARLAWEHRPGLSHVSLGRPEDTGGQPGLLTAWGSAGSKRGQVLSGRDGGPACMVVLVLPTRPPVLTRPARPQDLATLLERVGCLKYLQVFEEQDVDLRIF